MDRLAIQLNLLQAVSSLEALLDSLIGSAIGNQNDDKCATRHFLDQLIKQDSINSVTDLLYALQTYDINSETELAADAIRVMTMHKAKGLSAELVIIPALEQELLPGQYDESLARRLMYVAMTRARRTLIVTHALTRTGAQSHLGTAGGKWQRKRSSFLDEMNLRSINGSTFILGLEQTLAHCTDNASQQISSSALRGLIKESCSDEELQGFCFDHFRVVYDDFSAGMSKAAKIQRLIEYCFRHGKVSELLLELKSVNPYQYQKYQAMLVTTVH
jgi:ATP-dependent exoDNAse (exonuclease V) beta subunit